MIGLDIGDLSVKAVELNKTGNLFTLTNFRIQERQKGGPLAEALRNIFEKKGFDSKKIGISLSGPMVVARLAELPLMSEEELKGAVRFEAERYIPFAIDEAVLDYQVISKNADTKKNTILLAAAKADLVKGYVAAASQNGLAVKVADIDGIALTNAFLNAMPDEGRGAAACLLNCADTYLNMSVVYQSVPFVLRDINSLDGDLDKLAKEVNLSLGYFENQFAKGVDKIYLSGSSSILSGLKETLAESLDAKVELWDPLSHIKIGEKVSTQSLEAAKKSLAVAIGIALRDD